MTELMKRYEAETGRKMPERWDTWALIGWYDEYTHWLETKVEDEKRLYHQLDEMYIVVSRAEVNQRKEAEKLKDQLRWRPVSEKPKESDRYLVKYRQGKIVKKFIADYDVVLGWNMPLPDVEIIEWLPIPPAPEGE